IAAEARQQALWFFLVAWLVAFNRAEGSNFLLKFALIGALTTLVWWVLKQNPNVVRRFRRFRLVVAVLRVIFFAPLFFILFFILNLWRISRYSYVTQANAVSHIQHLFLRELRAFLDELEARLGLGAHQPLDRFRRLLLLVVLELDPQQRALLRVHRGFLELRR